MSTCPHQHATKFCVVCDTARIVAERDAAKKELEAYEIEYATLRIATDEFELERDQARAALADLRFLYDGAQIDLKRVREDMDRLPAEYAKIHAVCEAAKSAYLEKGGPATVLEERLEAALKEAGYLP